MQEKFEKAIKQAIVSRRAETPADRQRIYSAARTSLQKAGGDEAKLAELDIIVERIESTFAPVRRDWRSRFQRPWVLPVLTLVVGALCGSLLTAYLVGAHGGAKTASLARSYEKYSEQLPVARQYLRKVLDAVLDRQSSKPDSLAASARTFLPLAKFDEALAKTMPASLPRGTSVIVRADERNVKVLMNWTLCGIAQTGAPDLVDPVRSKLDTVGCPNFGLWTDGAAKW